MAKDIVREMCEDLLKLKKGWTGEPFDSKYKLFKKIGVPHSGTCPDTNSVNKDNEEKADSPRANSEAPIRNKTDRD